MDFASRAKLERAHEAAQRMESMTAQMAELAERMRALEQAHADMRAELTRRRGGRPRKNG